MDRLLVLERSKSFSYSSTQNAASDAAFCVDSSRLADAADLDRVRAFRRVRDLKGHLVTFAQFVESDSDELGRVEKEILFLTLALDEPETLIGETGDCSFLHVL